METFREVLRHARAGETGRANTVDEDVEGVMLSVHEIRKLTRGELRLLELDGGVWIGPTRAAASAPCQDCGIDTTPRDAEGAPIVGWEWYMLAGDVWARATGGKRTILCVGCLETRLGRRLTAQDFADVPINKPNTIDSARLRDRKTSGRGKPPMKVRKGGHRC